MAQHTTNNYNALLVVQQELQQSLSDALSTLNLYVESSNDVDALSNCISHLRQVKGTISLLNLQGASLLAEEIFNTASAIRDKQCSDLEKAEENLLHALMVLPHYLEILPSGINDHPLCLIETINELKQAQDKPVLDIFDYFKPTLSVPLPEHITPDPMRSIPELGIAKDKIAHAYQVSLLKWLREADVSSLKNIRALIHYLRVSCNEDRTTLFWWLTEGFIEALIDNGLTNSQAVKKQLGQLTPPIKTVTEHGEQELLAIFQNDQFIKLLLLIAQATSAGKHVSKIKDLFDIHYFDNYQQIYSVSNDAKRHVSQGLIEQIAEIKEQFNQYEYNEEFSNEDVTTLRSRLTPISATLGMMSELEAKSKLDDHIALLTELEETQQLPTGEQLEALADDLLTIDTELASPTDESNSSAVSELQKTVIEECLSELENIKEFLSLEAGNLTSDNLPDIAQQLHSLAGSINIVNLPSVSELLNETAQTLNQPHEQALSTQQVDVLAEVISACELYLDGLVTHGHAIESLITKAIQQITTLDELTTSDVNKEFDSNEQIDESIPVSSNYAFAEGIDAEIAETFLEEAEEVITALNQQQPKWQASNDEQALAEIRRNYHTLKGSGRMAGADSIADLAWSIENLLNKVIDGIIPSSTAIKQITDESLAELPNLIEAFKQGNNSSSIAAQELISNAENQLTANDQLELEDELIGLNEQAEQDADLEFYVIDNDIDEDLTAPTVDKNEFTIEPPAVNFADDEDDDLINFNDTLNIEPSNHQTLDLDGLEIQDTLLNEELPAPVPFNKATEAVDDDGITSSIRSDLTSVDRYIAAQAEKTASQTNDIDTVQKQPTSVDNYIAAQAEKAASQTSNIETAQKQPTSVDNYIAAQEKAASQTSDIDTAQKQPTSVDNYIAAQEKAASQTSDIDTAQKQPTSVDNYIAAQAEKAASQTSNIETAQKQPTSVDNYIAAQEKATPERSKLQIGKPENVVIRASKIQGDDDKQLQTIFLSEARQHINSMYKAIDELKPNNRVNNGLLRATHSLKGCANIAQVTSIALIANAFDKSLQDLHKYDVALSDGQLSLIKDTVSGIDSLLNSIETNTKEPDLRPLNDNCYFLIEDLPSTPSAPQLVDPDVLLVFLEETDELLAEYSQKLRKLQRQPDSTDQREGLHDILVKLSDNAQHAEQDSIAELYQQLDRVIQSQPILDQECFNILEIGYEHLNNDIESLLQNKVVSNEYLYIEQVDQFLAEKAQKDDVDTLSPITFDAPEIDYELLEAFIEENAELLESSGEAIKQWQATPDNPDASMQLQRDLHTLKGAARAIGQEPIGELTHQTESLVLAVSKSKLTADDDFFNLLHRCHDRLAEMQELLAKQQPLQYAHDLANDIAILSGEESTDSKPTPFISAPIQNETETKIEQTAPAPVEQIRVKADLLDYLTNFAGEVSISRDRVNQQNTAIHQQLKEMEDTVSRLQEQLRNLEIETENQILFRFEGKDSTENAKFDPLELDRFSMIQQLSRGLTESVSDLNDISQSMDSLVKETETILLQQSRVSADLQQGLMNTRLLPFNGITPRLERVIRQTNTELGKESNLTVNGASHEIDRTVLDKVTAPIEHIVRNAIAHGIETPEQRELTGKQQTGSITISVERQGSEFLITISDDGRGIDVEKVKQKALSLGLINADNIPADEVLISLILTSGFSTADNVSQVAGRGVGMDVVSNEIRSLKGRLSIQSTPGKGTTFKIRLPLTLSVIQALLVSTSSQQFALPLTNLHSGERISVAQIKSLMSNETPTYQFNGEQYDFIPLCHLLDIPLSLPENNKQQLPLLLLNTGSLRVALLVDQVNNAREIVIKSIGKQLNTINALNGATILGDGKVVFILDIPLLVEEYLSADNHYELQHSAATQTKTPVAMVVDDSITIRKASSNFLKRQGFEVMTAKDGVDALSQLTEKKPDIILLDIEMPRMDGFEFAAALRSDNELKHIPIIMITSRTGEKHRQRAADIGIDVYLGKPYQDDELIIAMQSQLGTHYPNSKV